MYVALIPTFRRCLRFGNGTSVFTYLELEITLASAYQVMYLLF